jgi:hypothetical protein
MRVVAREPRLNHAVVRLMIKRNVHDLADAHDLLALLNDRLLQLGVEPRAALLHNWRVGDQAGSNPST